MTTTELPTPADDLRAAYHRDGFDRLPDARARGAGGPGLAVPRVDPADSFVLHAPLELAARVALLPLVHPAAPRGGPPADRRASQTSTRRSDRPSPTPTAARFDSVADGAARLLAAIERGELDDVDEAARLARPAPPRPSSCSALLTDAVTPRLAAAAHAPIFLYQLPRVAPRGELTGELLRGLAPRAGACTGVAAALDRRTRHRCRAAVASGDELFDAVAATPGSTTPGRRRSSTR